MISIVASGGSSRASELINRQKIRGESNVSAFSGKKACKNKSSSINSAQHPQMTDSHHPGKGPEVAVWLEILGTWKLSDGFTFRLI